MPIKIPNDLPASGTLEAEGVIVIREADAIRQDIRPLRVGLLNLMPNKIGTETQIARLLGATPLQIDLTLVRLTDHVTRSVSQDHMSAFYRAWSEVQSSTFDGFIITGAPVERLVFEDVTYWRELQQIFNWTQTHVHASLNICWAAQAALYHFQGVQKYELPRKAFGVFQQRVIDPTSPYLRGFPDEFSSPVSRWSGVRREDISGDSDLRILADSDETGLCVVEDRRHRALNIFDHLEYEAGTLASEYFRDVGQRRDVSLPTHYFPLDDPSREPRNSWRGHAHLLFGNWVNQIYQTAPFEVERVGLHAGDKGA